MNISPHKAFIRDTLAQLYPQADHQAIAAKIEQLIQRWKPKTQTTIPLDQSRIWMIAYGDSICAQGKSIDSPPVCKTVVEGTISDIHLLPMFPGPPMTVLAWWITDRLIHILGSGQILPRWRAISI